MIQLRDVDLNLLVVLDALLREQSVTLAADRLHLTPSAVSHALKRLRKLFDDELLLRDGRRMRPTVRAESLAEALPKLLNQAARMIEPLEAFTPEVSNRTFHLAAPDFVAPLMPSLLQDIHAEAPGVAIELAPYTESVARDLAEGRYDALVAIAGLSNDSLRSTPLGSWRSAVYARAGHPAFDDWSATAWAAYPHLQVRPRSRTRPSGSGGPGPTDRRAAELGIHRVIRAVVPHFSMAAPILAKTDLLLTVPSVSMGDSVAAYDLDCRELPFDLEPLELSLFRSAAEGDEPGIRWFLERVTAAFVGPDHEST